jgi:hypothetical protein
MPVFDPTQSPLDFIPPPDLIRDRLAQLFVEVRLLRNFLRLSEAKCRNLGGSRSSCPERESSHTR